MTPAKAFDIASQWGSYMSDGDPGAVFYSFPPNDARPQDEQHRAALLAYTDSLIQDSKARPGKQAEVAELKDLRNFFAGFPLAPDEFSRGYITCALWASNDESDPETGGNPMDDNYSAADIAPETMADMLIDCIKFQVDAGSLLATAYANGRTKKGSYDSSYAGQDFWLSRNGYGAGFLDHNLGATGDVLTAAAKKFHETSLYVGDDGKIYAC